MMKKKRESGTRNKFIKGNNKGNQRKVNNNKTIIKNQYNKVPLLFFLASQVFFPFYVLQIIMKGDRDFSETSQKKIQ